MTQYSITNFFRLMFAFSLLIVVSGCSLRGDNPQSAPTQNNEQKAVAVEQVPVGDVDRWQTLAREANGFSMKFPNSWWWQQDSALQDELDASFAVGFALNEADLNARDYTAVFFITEEDELSSFEGYQAMTAMRNETRYVVRSKNEYADIVKKIGESLMLAEEVIDTSDWQTYRNEEYGFEFQYPKDLPELQKYSESIHDSYNIDKYLYLSFRDILSGPEIRSHEIGIIVKQYDKDDPIEHQFYEGAEWEIDHKTEKIDITSKEDGFYAGVSAAITDNSTEYQIKTVHGKKIKIYYEYFKPGSSYSKIAKIYFGNNKLIEFVAGSKISSLSEEFRAQPFEAKLTGDKSIDVLFEYFDQMLPTFKFMD